MVILSNNNYYAAYLANTEKVVGGRPRQRGMTNSEWIAKQGGRLTWPDWDKTYEHQKHARCIEFEDEKLATLFILRWA